MPSLICAILLFVVTSIALSQPAQAAREEALPAGMVNPGYEEHPDWFRDSFLDLRDDVGEAARRDKRVLLYFYQDGCPYCKKLLQDNLGQRAIADKARGYFDVIALNIWGDREVTDLAGKTVTEKDFARQMRVMFTPTLLALNEKGEQVLRINGYYAPHQFAAALDYAGQKKEDKGSFRDYFAALSPAPAKGKLHQQPGYLKPPFRLDEALKRTNKPLLVLFEQKECAACDELHLDIFKRKESRALLDKFQIVLLDFWSNFQIVTPEGHTTTAREWAKALNVNYAPTMVFFGAGGAELFRTSAYLRAFHVQSVLDYVASGAYREYPEFQRYIDARADGLRARGIEVDLMK